MLATRGVLSVTVSVGYEPVPLLRRHVLRLFRRLLLVRMGHGQAIAARVHLSEQSPMAGQFFENGPLPTRVTPKSTNCPFLSVTLHAAA